MSFARSSGEPPVGCTLCTSRGKHVELSCLDERQRYVDGQEHHVDLATQQILYGTRRALVGDVHDVDAGGGLEHFHREMVRRSVAWGAVEELARIGLGVCDEFLDAFRGDGGVCNQCQSTYGKRRNGGEVLDRIVRNGLEEKK